jgi:hypothetical protein
MSVLCHTGEWMHVDDTVEDDVQCARDGNVGD